MYVISLPSCLQVVTIPIGQLNKQGRQKHASVLWFVSAPHLIPLSIYRSIQRAKLIFSKNKKLYSFPRPYYHDRRTKQKKGKGVGLVESQCVAINLVLYRWSYNRWLLCSGIIASLYLMKNEKKKSGRKRIVSEYPIE
jgi:hypothetical protein